MDSCVGAGSVTNIAPVGSAPLGAGLWGQLDLAGEVLEWNLDWYASYVDPCGDCADLTMPDAGPMGGSPSRVGHGGSFYTSSQQLRFLQPSSRDQPLTTLTGFRCARSP